MAVIGKYGDKTLFAKSFTFSGGECHLRIPGQTGPIDGDITIKAQVQSAQDLVELMMFNEIVDRQQVAGRKKLILPYFPYARQDRIMDENEAFSLKPFCALINSMGFDEVVSYDVHSDVAPALVNRIRVVPQHEIMLNFFAVRSFIEQHQPVIVSPDAGAAKKAFKVSNAFGVPLICARKIRDTATGEITGTAVEEFDLQGKSTLIVDDICDGGKTFIELAKVLRAHGARVVDLYVTHGIFSKGFSVFEGLIDMIYCTNSFSGKLPALDQKISMQKFILP